MTFDEILKHRDTIYQLVGRYHLKNPRVFGSVVQGHTTKDSDVDFLVDATSDTTLFDIGGLQQALSELLKKPVDVVTPEELNIRFREQVVLNAKQL